MNIIRKDLPYDVQKYFKNMQNYLDTDLYFYGSIARDDYIPGKSDIDIAIFTDNENSIMTKLQHYLHVKRNAFDKVVWKLNGNMIYGYKIKCKDVEDKRLPKYVEKCEIAIYNNEFKNILLDDMNKGSVLPVHISVLLRILKMFHYTIPLIPLPTYVVLKRYVFDTLYLNKKSVFFLLPKDKTI
jgi:predicted nucleotidyltransferase